MKNKYICRYFIIYYVNPAVESSTLVLTNLLTYVNNLFKNDEADIIWYNTTLAIQGAGTIIIGRNLINY